MATGWALADGTWYYAASSGAIQRGRWIKSGSAWYYLDDVSGAMRTGEFAVGSTRYISYDSGAMASSCWINLSNGMAWANSSGALSEPLPTTSDGSPVVADRTDSSSLPGTIHIGDAVFYADANGAVNVASGWLCRKTLLTKAAILGITHLPMVSLSLVGNMLTVRGIGWILPRTR